MADRDALDDLRGRIRGISLPAGPDSAWVEVQDRLAVEALTEYAIDPATLRYAGIRVVNLPYEEGQRGRRRRAHIIDAALREPSL